MLNTIVIILTVFSAIAGLVVAIWSYMDTQRVRSYQDFSSERNKKHEEARERFNKRSRPRKEHD